jgi:hypothetical protein
MDIHGYHAGMAKKNKSTVKRPAVLVRFYQTDLAALNLIVARACTPRENYCRRAILDKVRLDQLLLLGKKPEKK